MRTSLLLLVAWTMAFVVTLLVAAHTRIGPVVVPLSPTHGLHLGDVLTGVAALATAVAITAWATRRRPPALL